MATRKHPQDGPPGPQGSPLKPASVPALVAVHHGADVSAVPLEAPLTPQRKAAIKAAVLNSRAARTNEAYTLWFGRFAEWCDRHGRNSVPATHETVAAFLTALQDGTEPRERNPEHSGKGCAPATIELALSAIVVANRYKGHSIDRRADLIKEALRGLKRDAGTGRQKRKAHPLRGSDVVRLLDTMTGSVKDLRDAALIALGVAAAMRRAELIGLDLGRIGGGTGALTNTGAGFDVILSTSKTEQGEEVRIAVPAADAPAMCDAIQRWIDRAGIRPGAPLFQSLTSTGKLTGRRLTGRDVSRIIKARVAGHPKFAHLAGIVSGHSLRAGFVTSAADAGVPLYDIMAHSRHKTADVARGYIRDADRWKNNPLAKIKW